MKSPQQKLFSIASFLFALLFHANLTAQTLHVDPSRGNDDHSGSAAQPLASLARAAEMANAGEGGATTVRLHPGLHVLEESPLFEREAAYASDKRLIIEAVHMPDDEGWSPALMPVVISIEAPHLDGVMVTYGLRIEVSHATVRGIKFLGNPWPGAFYYGIWREGIELEDLLVSQCLFLGDREALPIHLPIIANGNGVVVDHCIFYGCKNSVVFWDGPGGNSTGNAMSFCIVDGAYGSAVWTCSTERDFRFHNNVLTRNRYAWVREQDSERIYDIQDCMISNNELEAGHGGGAAGKWVTTDGSFLRMGAGVERQGKVVLSHDPASPGFLHPLPESPGSELGAGLFLFEPDH